MQEFNKREWPEFLLARGRAKEALAAAATMAAHRSAVVSAAGHVEAGRARLALGQFREAADEGNAALHLIRGAEGGGIVAAPLQAFQGEFLLRTGKAAQGRPMLEEVVRKARALPGPDAWVQALFTIEAVARAAREVGDWELATWAAGRCSSTIRTTPARTRRWRRLRNTAAMRRPPRPSGRGRSSTGRTQIRT